MEIQIPAIPAGVLTLLSIFSPFAIALINHPRWRAGSKRLVAIFVSIVLTLVVLMVYYAMTGDLIPQWPVLLLLCIVVGQAVYSALWPHIKQIEGQHGTK